MISVAVVGRGAIGGVVADALAAQKVPGARLAGIIIRNGSSVHPRITVDRAAADADLVVEAAGQQALTEIAPTVLDGRAGLLVTSVGALRHDATFKLLSAAPPGRVHLTTGAVGGLDLLRSAARMAPLDAVRIVTTKKPAALVQPWMTDAEASALRTATAPVEVKRGPAKEITGLFPASANVAASVALAAGSWDVTEAVVMADPDAAMTSHVITASGPAGEYRFEIRNRPSSNPKSSAVVAPAVLKAIEDLAGSAAWSFR